MVIIGLNINNVRYMRHIQSRIYPCFGEEIERINEFATAH